MPHPLFVYALSLPGGSPGTTDSPSWFARAIYACEEPVISSIFDIGPVATAFVKLRLHSQSPTGSSMGGGPVATLMTQRRQNCFTC